MRDFLRKELALGDDVVTMVPRYRSLVKAKIIAFTPRKVRVEYTNTWNYGRPGVVEQLLQDPDQLVKIEV
jgi:hypothetical protein